MLITILISGFLFFLTRSIAMYQIRMDLVDAERAPLLPLLILQFLILFILGTAQVAGGMTAERDEGVIDYQRLIPNSSLSKVFGYLFGLPVREYVMFLVTLPFTAWALWRGEIAVSTWLPLYGVLLSTTWLYHLTGLLTGTVVKNRRWAFLVSIGVVFCLYTIIPQMANFGFVFFNYLTVTPVFRESLPGLLPSDAGQAMALTRQLLPSVKFFDLDFSETVFTLFSQGGLILTFLVMLCRKWRRNEAPLLGKLWATGFFIWIQILLLGNALPLVEPGNLFPSRELSRYARMALDWTATPAEAVAMSGAYGLVTLVLLFILAGIITPTPDRQIRGWRRARKQGASRLPFLSDAATGFWFVAIMALAGAAGWYLFTREVVESRWFPGHDVPIRIFGYFAAVMLAAGLGYQVLMEAKGGRAVGMATIFVGVVPLMVGVVLGASSARLLPVASWLVGSSPVSLPVYASASLLSLSELPESVARALPRAFHFWLLVAVVVMLWLTLRLWNVRSARAKSGLEGTKED